MKADDPRVVHYRIALPPGWVRIELDETADESVRKLVDAAGAAAAPENRPAVKAFMSKQLTDLVTEGRERGGQDFYLPIEPVDGIPLAMSIMVATGPAPDSSSTSALSETLLAFASQHNGSTAVEIDGQLGVRTFSDVEEQRDEQGRVVTPASRRIDYLSATPTPSGRMLFIAASLLRSGVPEGERIVEAMEFLFDAMVRTIRFDRSEVAA